MSLRTELIRLFGKTTWTRAKSLQPHYVDAATVADAAGELLSMKGDQAGQIALARSMPPEMSAALCRWLSEPAFWSVVAGIKVH